MIHYIFDTVRCTFRNMGNVAQFDGYYRKLQDTPLSGVPTVDEARKDYHGQMRQTISTL
jgi:hypothetical protein